MFQIPNTFVMRVPELKSREAVNLDYLKFDDPTKSVAIIEATMTNSMKTNKDDQYAENAFYQIKIFGTRAVAIAPQIKPGMDLLVTGTINTFTYTDKEGNKRTGRTEINATDIMELKSLYVAPDNQKTIKPAIEKKPKLGAKKPKINLTAKK